MLPTLLLLLLAAAPAPSKTAPAPQLHQLDYFSGRWRCEARGASAPGKWADLTISPELDGYWFSALYQQPPSVGPLAVTTSGHWGYNAASGDYFFLYADNFGGWGTATSKGWTGNLWIWNGEKHYQQYTSAFRKTHLRRSSTEFVVTVEVQGADKKWNKAVEEVCAKSSDR